MNRYNQFFVSVFFLSLLGIGFSFVSPAMAHCGSGWVSRDTVQNEGTQPVEGKALSKYDTIVLTSGRKVAATIRTVNATQVSYFAPDSPKERTYSRKNVYKIIYTTGRIEKLGEMAYESITDSDWRIVILTDDPQMVEGMYSHGIVHGESNKNSRTLRVAKRNAETRLKKRAVAKKGLIVLVTKRTSTGGYGEVPKYYVEGEVYGTEPLEEGADTSSSDD